MGTTRDVYSYLNAGESASDWANFFRNSNVLADYLSPSILLSRMLLRPERFLVSQPNVRLLYGEYSRLGCTDGFEIL